MVGQKISAKFLAQVGFLPSAWFNAWSDNEHLHPSSNSWRKKMIFENGTTPLGGSKTYPLWR